MVSNGHSQIDFDYMFTPINLLVWGVILVFAAVVFKSAGKK